MLGMDCSAVVDGIHSDERPSSSTALRLKLSISRSQTVSQFVLPQWCVFIADWNSK